MTNHTIRAFAFCSLCTAVAALGCGGLEQGMSLQEEEDALRVCAPGATVRGIDVSHWDGQVDWAAVKGAGKDFAFIRVSDGTNHFDGTFATNWADSQANGLIRGVYQFFRPGQDPIAQADLLIQNVGQLGAGDLPAVMDIEVTDGVSSHTIARRAVEWLDRVEQGTGKKPIIYTSAGLWPSFGNPSGATSHDLWVANYTTRCPSVPSGWSHWTFWQYSESSHVAGVSGAVDANVFNGSLSDLTSYAGL